MHAIAVARDPACMDYLYIVYTLEGAVVTRMGGATIDCSK